MAIDLSKGEDTVIKITPRMLAVFVILTIGVYAWLFTTFATASQLSSHINKSDLRFVKADIENTQDKLFDLKERMKEPNGDTGDRRQKADEYGRRIDDLKETRACIQQIRNNC